MATAGPPRQPEVNAFLICDSVARDSGTGKAIITGVFDRIWVQRFPSQHPLMAAYFRVNVPGGQNSVGIRLGFATPSGLSQQTPELRIVLKQTSIAEGSINIQGFPINEAGPYTFKLLLDDKPVATYVVHVGEPKAQSHGPVH